MSAWPDWIKLIQLKPKYLLGFFVLGLFLLTIPAGLASFLGLSTFRTQYRGWIGFETAASLVFFAVQISHPITEKIREKKRRRYVLKAMDGLSYDERIWLLYAVYNCQKTIYLKIGDPGAMALCHKGLLIQAGRGNVLAYPFIVPNFVWDKLMAERTQILSSIEKTPHLKDLFKEHDRDMRDTIEGLRRL